MGVVAGYPKLVEVEQPNANRRGERSIRETYIVLVDDVVNDSIYTARDATGIPVVNSTWSYGNNFDNGVYATDYSTRLRERQTSHLLYEVVVTYKTMGDEREDEQSQDNPVNMSPIISGSGVRHVVKAERDRFGNDIKNLVGDPWPDVQMDADTPTLRIEKNYSTIDYSQLLDFANTVNDDTFWTLPAGHWKLSFPQFRELFRGNVKYYNVVFEFQGRNGAANTPLENWDLRLVEKGHHFWKKPLEANVEDRQKTRFEDKQGNIMGAPQRLTFQGGRLPDDQPGVFTTFKIYEERDFGLLGIPTAP